MEQFWPACSAAAGEGSNEIEVVTSIQPLQQCCEPLHAVLKEIGCFVVYCILIFTDNRGGHQHTTPPTNNAVDLCMVFI